ncbi:MAG: YdcH family protein [Nitrospinota bacterium]
MLAELESEYVEKALEMDSEFKELYNQHHLLQKKIAKMSKSPHLSSILEAEKRRLQKVKLAGKDRMSEIIKGIREN